MRVAAVGAQEHRETPSAAEANAVDDLQSPNQQIDCAGGRLAKLRTGAVE